MQGLLDKLDVIECFEEPGHAVRVGEILEKQKELYAAMDIRPPVSLWVAGNPGGNINFIAAIFQYIDIEALIQVPQII